MTMAAGGFKAPLFCVAWPTGEVGGMGLEGAVRLGYRKELAEHPLVGAASVLFRNEAPLRRYLVAVRRSP